jgi:hypothetical protein
MLKKATDRGMRRWRAVALVAAGLAIGVTMMATPAVGHVGGTVNHLWGHLKPKADARYAKKNVEAWHEVGAAGQPAFENGWVNYGGSFATAAFYKDTLGVVHLRGLVMSGTAGTTIFQLPVGYRPGSNKIFTTRNASGSGELRIEQDCFFVCTDFQYVIATTGSNTWFSLEGVSFRAGG